MLAAVVGLWHAAVTVGTAAVGVDVADESAHVVECCLLLVVVIAMAGVRLCWSLPW